MKLLNKILLVVFFAVIVPAFVIFLFYWFQVREELVNQTLRELETIAEIKESDVTHILDHFVVEVRTFTEELHKIIPMYDVQNDGQFSDTLLTHIGHELALLDQVDGLGIYNNTNELLYEKGQLLDNVILREVSTSQNGVSYEFIEIVPGEFIFQIKSLIQVSEVFSGFVVFQYDLEEIHRSAEQYVSLGETGDIIYAIENQNGDAVFIAPRRFEDHPQALDVISGNDFTRPITHSLDGEEIIIRNATDYRGERVFAATRYIPQYQVGVAVEKDVEEVFSVISQLDRDFLFVYVIVIGGTIGLVVIVSIRMTSRLRKLQSAAIEISKGNFKKVKEMLSIQKRGDELALLETSMRFMASKVEELLSSIEDRVAMREKDLQKDIKLVEEQKKQSDKTKKAVLNILEDLKEEKQRAEEESENALKFKLATDESTESVLITDPDQHILYVNPAFTELNGYTFEEIKGERPKKLSSGNTPREVYDEMWSALKKGKSFVSEKIVNKRKDGSVYDARVSIFPIVERGEILYYVGIQNDITVRKQVEEAKTEFISVASHQLRTPLSAMSWFVEALYDEDLGELNEDQKEYMQQLSESTKRLIKLVNDLLNVSRIESGRWSIEPSSVDVVKMVEGLISEIQPLSEAKNCAITIQKPKGKKQIVEADKDLITQVTQNLITNAIKYSKTTCDITITISQEKDGCQVAVSDKGIGMEEEFQQHVFQKFHRSDRATALDTEGSGLGLYIAKLIIEAHNGKIWFESEEGKGTTFYFKIPYKGVQGKSGEVKLT